jgi:NADPH2:quinone reductase
LPGVGDCRGQSSDQVDYVRSLGAEEVILRREACIDIGRGECRRRLLDARRRRAVRALRRGVAAGGTWSLVGGVGGSDVRFDAFELIRPMTLTGYSSATPNGKQLRAAIASLVNWMIHDRIKAPAHRAMPLAERAGALALVKRRGFTADCFSYGSV